MFDRIVLATAGSLGDLHPFLALGLALKARGLRAEIATAPDYRAKVEAEGLGFHAVGPSTAELSAELGMTLGQITEAVARSDNFLFERIALPYLEAGTRQLITAADGAAAIVGTSLAIGAAMAAERLDIPFVAVALQPTTVFSAFDPPHLPRAPWLALAEEGPRLWLNRATLAAGRLSTAHWKRPVNAVRRSLGLSNSSAHPLFDGVRRADLALGLYSPLLGQAQPDAPPDFLVTGYAPYDSEIGGAAVLPPELEAFLDAGPAPVVLTLGSAAVHIPGRFYREGLRAARTLGLRAVLLMGPEGDATVADGPDALAVGYAPFSLLFPRAAAIIHQGGVGTVQQALRAGKPQLVVPHLGDQFDNGRRIAGLGCGTTLAREDFQSGKVAERLDRLLNDPALAAIAARLGETAMREDGAAVAATRIAALISR